MSNFGVDSFAVPHLLSSSRVNSCISVNVDFCVDYIREEVDSLAST